MQFDEVVRTLEKAGTAQTRKTWARHGIPEPMYGVNYSVLRPLAKKLKTNQPLAEQLWQTGNHDCRTLAAMIADPRTMKKSTLMAWAKTIGNRCSAGELARVVAASPYADELGAKWRASKNKHENWLGWTMIAEQAMNAELDADLDNLFVSCLKTIERDIATAENFTRYAMNGALIAIGGRNEKLKKLALAAAKKIGKVEVDHGDTCCKTPEAAPYIATIWARKK